MVTIVRSVDEELPEIRQGDVFWYDFGPANGSAPAERRPCVVVQSDFFNETRLRTTVVCVITSNLHRASAPGNLVLPKGAAGLAKPSVVNVTQLYTVNKAALWEHIGRVSAEAREAIRTGIQLLFD